MLLILVSAAALLQSTLSSSAPLIVPGSGAPMAENGIWALLPADCAAPTSLDISTWDKCSQPLGFVDDQVAVLERPGPGKRAKADQFYSIARTHYAAAAGVQPSDPEVVQIDVPMVFSHTFLYLAVTPKSVAGGRFEDAQAWPVACLAQSDGGCTATTLAQVQGAAIPSPTDAARLYRLMRVTAAAVETALPAAPTSPSASPITPAPIEQQPLPPVPTKPPG